MQSSASNRARRDRRRGTVGRIQVFDLQREIRVALNEEADGQILKLLSAEALDVSKAMREFLLAADRFLYFAGVIAAGTFVLGFLTPDNGSTYLLFIFAPYPLIIVFGYLMQVYTEVERRAGYKKFLEEEINRRLGTVVLLESTINSDEVRSRLSGTLMKAIQGVMVVGFIALSVRATWRFSEDGLSIWGARVINWNGLNILLLLLAFISLVQSVVENSRASRMAYETARRIVSQG